LPFSIEVCYKDFTIGGLEISRDLCLAPLDILSGASIIQIILDVFGLGILGNLFPSAAAAEEEGPPAAVAEQAGNCRPLGVKFGGGECNSAWMCTDPDTNEPCVTFDCSNVDQPDSNLIKASSCSPMGFFPETRSDARRVDELKMIAFDPVE